MSFTEPVGSSCGMRRGRDGIRGLGAEQELVGEEFYGGCCEAADEREQEEGGWEMHFEVEC